tara:strand:- start:97 stop:873 length:777 start_codon:yes stop_codon:yes gene_type:complete
MNYLIVSPVRTGSTWLNRVIAGHYDLFNIGESLCKLSPMIDPAEPTAEFHVGRTEWLPIHQRLPIRDMSQMEQMKLMKDKNGVVIKMTPFDLYDTDNIDYNTEEYGRLIEKTNIEYNEIGYGYSMSLLKEHLQPLTKIFLYRKNIPENFLSFLAMHNTGIHNTYDRFMNYKRPKRKIKESWTSFYKMHFDLMEKCYRDHIDEWDHVISYEELFKMDELCGIPLKQYHESYTLKLNRYDRDEIEEVKKLTGYSENYEIH